MCKPTSDIASMRDLNLQQYPGAPCGDFSSYCNTSLKCQDYTTDLFSKLKAASTIHREECENVSFKCFRSTLRSNGLTVEENSGKEIM